MLRLLLGHWKSHRKKPSLLPEDGDVRFEDPSRINPLFEDSDSSTSSTKVPAVVSAEIQNHSASEEEFEQEQGENDEPVISELVDITVPIKSDDSKNSGTVLSGVEEISTEKPKHADPKKQKDSVQSETAAASENLSKDDPSVISDNENAIKIVEELFRDENSEAVLSKDETKSTHLETEEKMRIWNQPSTSAILRESEKSVSNTQKEIENSSRLASKSNGVYKNKEEANNQEQLPEKKSETSKTSNNRFITAETQNVKDNVPSSKPVQSNNHAEKSGKSRGRAIDELIKKFQGSSTENNEVANKFTDSEKKDLPHPSKENNKFLNKISESEKTDVPSPSVANDKLVNKTVKFEKKDLPGSPITNDKVASKIEKSEKKDLPSSSIPNDKFVNNTKNAEKKDLTSPSIENDKSVSKSINSGKQDLPKSEPPDVSSKNNPERESLSNIFKFPPPPPIEHIPNKSSLHGKMLGRDSKINNPFSMSNKIKDNSEISRETEQGKTRSDSSLDRTRTASSNKTKENKEKNERDNKDETAVEISAFKDTVMLPSNTNRNSEIKKLPTEKNDDSESKKTNVPSARPKATKTEEVSHPSKLEKLEKIPPETKISEPTSPTTNDNARKNSAVSNRNIETEASVSNIKSSKNKQKDIQKSPDQKLKSSISKTFIKTNSAKENENVKSHSEDSGITRGDQISSETTQEAAPSNPQEEASILPNLSRKNRKDKKLKSISKKHCKNCRKTHEDGTQLKRSQCDDYYDGLTGVRHSHRGRHSDSWTSDLSWEEKELLRRLRSRRGTVRSNTPSTRSRHSRHRFVDENHFRRPHNLRRSFSDDSTFYGGSSVCSCDECWTLFVKDYAYGRASLRGMPPIHEMCTCQTSRSNILGRRVQFRSEPIHEASPSEKTTRTTTPAPSADTKQEDDATDDKSSQQSSKTKDDESVHKNPDGSKEKKSKSSEEIFRFVTPWELEEWDFLMRKHLLHRRRRRARCMGIMALAMVVFVGLVVAILMVYLRRKVI